MLKTERMQSLISTSGILDGKVRHGVEGRLSDFPCGEVMLTEVATCVLGMQSYTAYVNTMKAYKIPPVSEETWQKQQTDIYGHYVKS